MTGDNFEKNQSLHEISLVSRKKMKINGVLEVESFDEQTVCLSTECGELTIEGNGIHVDVLDIDKQILELSGNLNSFFYTDKKINEKKTFFDRFVKS